MMTLDMTEILNADHIRSSAIQLRTKESSKTRNTKHYLFSCNQAEVGFVSLDSRRDLNCLVLYEIFVPQELRHQGIGTQMILQVLLTAKRDGWFTVAVAPFPFENDWSEDKLVAWYFSKGFTPIAGNARELEMRL